jgi:hypothetical protein
MLRRALLFLLATSLFVLGLGILAFLFNTHTGREKNALARIEQEEKRLAATFDVVVLQSGYRKKESGRRDIYVPSLLVRVTNISEGRAGAASVRVDFVRRGRTFCRAYGLVPELKAGENSELWLKCIDFVGFGSVAWGLSLAETTETMEYRISLECQQVGVTVLQSKLRTAFF